MGGEAIGPTLVQLVCEQKEKRAADRGDHAIDRAGEPERPEQLRSKNEEAAVDQDLPRCCSPSRDDRQHRDAGSRVIVTAIERESPEMRRGPKEDNEEQGKRLTPICAVAAAHPITGGSAPAAPPMTMFWDVARFSHAVYTTT